ncbi:hypothetical protein CBER1_07545 [Cercospora berteroae]|uniref:Uncharacterized protein n=1 Tax=Cercospora berteroae TaxID=357750 RepID=A0A2S6BU76_9PEZI|nr:hypothetical protein CBER1_07545 [Cercospora berteroae]
MSSTAAPGLSEARSMCCQEYLGALAFYYQKECPQTVETAKANLKWRTLPAYWHIKNCILVSTCTTDIWEGERYRIAAERVWKNVKEQSSRDHKHEQFMLERLRSILDELKERLERLEDEEDEEESEEESEEGTEDVDEDED